MKGEPKNHPQHPKFLILDPAGRNLRLTNQESFWIAVNGVDVWIRPMESGVRVELYRVGKAMEDELASCQAEVWPS